MVASEGIGKYKSPKGVSWIVYIHAESDKYGNIQSPLEIPALRLDMIQTLTDMGVEKYELGRAWVICEQESDAILLYMRYR